MRVPHARTAVRHPSAFARWARSRVRPTRVASVAVDALRHAAAKGDREGMCRIVSALAEKYAVAGALTMQQRAGRVRW